MPAPGDAVLVVAEPRGRYQSRLPLVIDCSVLAALLFDEPQRDAAAMAMAGKDLYAPWLINDEIISVAIKKARTQSTEVVQRALTDLSRLRLTRCQTEPEAQWRLALAHDLSAYDAAYLHLAIELRAPLATFDRKLGEVAQRVLGDFDDTVSDARRGRQIVGAT